MKIDQLMEMAYPQKVARDIIIGMARPINQQLVKLVPLAGVAISGAIAGAGTYAIGKSAETYFFSGVIRPEA